MSLQRIYEEKQALKSRSEEQKFGKPVTQEFKCVVSMTFKRETADHDSNSAKKNRIIDLANISEAT